MHQDKEKKVLFVDDEVSIIESIKRQLRKEDYLLLTAENAEDALSLLEKHSVQVVISDYRMPGMSGAEFLQKVKHLYPDTVRVILSGFVDVAVLIDAINKGEIYRFLGKPWNGNEIKVVIQQCIHHYELLQHNKKLVREVESKNRELIRLNTVLEERVDEKKQLLILSRKILESLPLPVLGVDRERLIVLANPAARENFPGLVVLGEDIRNVFPGEAVKVVEQCLKGIEKKNSIKINWQDRKLFIRVASLNYSEGVRGCVVILEVENVAE